MKILIVDTSHNSSAQKVKAFLYRHSDADIVFSFDHFYSEYPSAKDLMEDIEEIPDEFFLSPCAYYDMTTYILGKIRKLPAKAIIIYSPQIDECSRLSNEFLYDNYMQHFNAYNPGILDLNYSAIEYAIPSLPSVKTPIKNLLQRITEWDPFSLKEESNDYDDYYSAS